MQDLQREILEEFASAGEVASCKRIDAENKYLAERREEKRESDRERKAHLRDVQAIVAEIRRLEGISERFCFCGCGRMFPIQLGAGRPRLYATEWCRVRSCIARKLAKLKSDLT